MHNLKVFLALVSINLKSWLEYRTSFFVSFILNILWVASFVVLIEVIFFNVPSLGGLQKGEALLVMAFYYLFQNIGDIFYRDGFETFSETVRRGQLDMWLLKPASSRLLAIMNKTRVDHCAAFINTIILFFYAIKNLPAAPSFGLLLVGISYSLIASVLFFCILSIISTFTFFIEKNESLHVTIWHFTQIARYPRNIFTGVVKQLVTYGLPIALLANIPAEITLKIASGNLHYYFLAITVVLFFISKWFWNFGLRRYTSAA